MYVPGHSPHPDHSATGADDLYATKPPWDIDRPQPALLALARAGALRGRVLDIGCGTGEHALPAAMQGHDAVGVDQSEAALETARAKARDRGLTVRFIRHDACRLGELAERFDTVLDCGLFHIFDGSARAACVDSLRAAITPGGRYLMVGFSDPETGTWGPRRLSRTEITEAFGDGWHVDSIEPTELEIIPPPRPGRRLARARDQRR
ncbi:class I SAM-dependent methyltransferase [Nocardia seriolae]|uniref:class I SAM-dependent methyltransferase n=1 Tax=Nocardia seriolae TaxID=37332 RepID=UPI001E4C4698|nr:class I SAM-dependent methyltransferase [Nocardia seriolae]